MAGGDDWGFLTLFVDFYLENAYLEDLAAKNDDFALWANPLAFFLSIWLGMGSWPT